MKSKARKRIQLRPHVLALSALGLGGVDCLPGDTRPTPASLLVTVESSPATRNGFTTGDGWTITFDRVIGAIGDVRLDDPPDQRTTTCNAYSEPGYERLFDFVKLAGLAKVGLAYGLGRCSVSYRMRSPNTDTLLETGVTADDVTFMRTEETDPVATTSRVSVRFVGRAERGGVEKRFDWSFRRGMSLDRCSNAAGDGYDDQFELKGGRAITLPLVVTGEELFRSEPNDEAPLSFDLLASADTDGDGQITFDELAKVPSPPIDFGTGGAGGSGAGGGATLGVGGGPNAIPITTLADFVYAVILPRVSRVAGGGACQSRPR